MEKPKTLSGLESLLRELKNDRADFKYKEVDKPVETFRREIWQKNKVFLDKYDEKITAVEQEIRLKKKELKSNKSPEFIIINKWVQSKYCSGVDFGYGGIKLRYIDPNMKYIICTNGGGTAGTGTPMGTGGYYYSGADHFVVFPQFGIYIDSKLPHYQYRSTNTMFTEHGKLTNEVRNKMIEKAEDYCKNWNVQPFNIEKL